MTNSAADSPASPATAIAVDTGIDRKQLSVIKKRFLHVNEARLARTKSALSLRQQLFLELLPMLFHVNHPMLPGYCSHSTPSGLMHYQPSRRDILKTQRMVRSFSYHRDPTLAPQINSLFLMGSTGTVAQSERSDLDIWVCHSDSLNSEQSALLQKKCSLISQWSQDINLEVHFFLMAGERFRLGEREELSGEDCGSSQHYLLLDEFYRTGLLIGGCTPIWWLVPPKIGEGYDDYARNLREKRYIRENDAIDFGGVYQIPAGEFIGAGIWQLYKAIDSPYKSVLKILLTEIYAAEYPKLEALSTTFKRAIYDDQLNIDELDPYVMVYRKLEAYLLQRGESARLELVRRCFYFKIGIALSRPHRNTNKSWQRLLIEKLVAEWRWDADTLTQLDTRNQWKVARVIDEQKLLVRELTNSYRFLLDFARRTQSNAHINSQDMTVLGRKLYAAFERKAGKVEWINPGIAPNLSEDTLTFYQVASPGRDHLVWAVNAEPASHDPTQASILKRSDSLLGLLVWCQYNGLLDSATRTAVRDGGHQVSDYELHNIIQCLRQHMPAQGDHGDDEHHHRFARHVRPTHMQLFINVGIDPMQEIRSQGVERLTSQTDSLVYSGMRDNLVLNIEQLLCNSWGEIGTRAYTGPEALLRCLRDYLQLQPPGGDDAPPKLDIYCFCPTRAAAIALRVETLFRDVAACYYSGTRPPGTRYILEIQREFYLLQFVQQRPRIERAKNYRELLLLLSRPQQSYSPIVLDHYCLQDSILAALAPFARPDCIQVFYQRRDKQADIYTLDEMGSLSFFSTAFHDQASLLGPLDLFLQSTLLRQSSTGLVFGDSALPDINLQSRRFEYYEIRVAAGRTSIQPCAPNPASQSHFFNVQAIGNRDSSGRLRFSIYCDQREFSELQWGNELYNKVARHILSQRSTGERYPCYITDLDLSDYLDSSQGRAQTSRYLHYKQQLERALNHALLNL